MSMIENFLNAKELLRDDLDEIREEALQLASVKAGERIDEFIEGVKVMVAEASDAEFIELITSGKLDDEDLNAVLMFRANGKKSCEVKTSDKPCEEPNETEEKREPRVHVIVLEV